MGETRYIHKPTFPQERRQVHEFNVTCILYRRTGREATPIQTFKNFQAVIKICEDTVCCIHIISHL